MDALQQIHLGNPLQAELLKHINQQARLHAVAGEKRELLQRRAAAGVLAGQRLDHARQLWIKQIEQRPGRQLGHPPPAPGLSLVPHLERAAIEAFDELDAPVEQKRPDDAIDKSRMNVDDVSINPGNDVALRHQQTLPQGFALAAPRAEFGQKLLVNVNRHAERLGNLAGAVGRVRVNQHHLVQQRHIVHQGPLHGFKHPAHRFLLVQSGQGQADRHPALLFERCQVAEIGKLVGVKGVLGKPLVHQNRNGLRSGGFIGHVDRHRAARLDSHHRRRGLLQDAVGHRAKRGPA